MTVFRRSPITTFTIVVTFLAMLGLTTCVVTGYFVPRQTSTITEVGICETDKQYSPVAKVTLPVDNLFICGVIEGSTRRSVWFYIYDQDRAIAHMSGTVGPGPFFISRIAWISPLAPGNYRIEAGYEKPVVIRSKFDVR
ncbi:MAG: hypothetical protein U0X20_32040 [Caldilineaceae bacterium]